MPENRMAHSHGAHHGPTLRLYLVIACCLALFTAVSFIVNSLVRDEKLPAETGFAVILGVAIAKAILVGLFFMHLKDDWGKLYFLIVPVFILAVVLVIVLLPDNVIAWHEHPQPPVSRDLEHAVP
jgi:cytochrome c oxidase subunit IV